MNLSAHDLKQLAQAAISAARSAGGLIAQTRPVDVRQKTGGESLASQVVTEVDRASQDVILNMLEPTFAAFDLALLTEESDDDGSRFHKDYFWCIDPLDGTLPFVEGTPGYSVSIALVARDGTPQIGVVFDPVASALYCGVRGRGSVRPGGGNDAGSMLSFFTDRSFKESPRYQETLAVLGKISKAAGLAGVDVRQSGGAVMNAIQVLENPPACYCKFPKTGRGGGSLWDFAATACIFAEADAAVSDFYGAPLDLNREDSTFMNHRGVLYATDQGLAGTLMTMLS